MIRTLATKLRTLLVLTRAGVLRPEPPGRALRLALVLHRFGPTPAAGAAICAIRCPHEPAVIDEIGMLTFGEVHRRTNALARAFAADGLGPGDAVALLARNHRYFTETTIACSKLGADVLFLNTSFAAPQAAAVLERERPAGLVVDSEFAALADEAARGLDLRPYVALADDGESPPARSLEDLMVAADDSELVPPPEPGRVVILTSGTTGTPKGAPRASPDSLDPIASFLSLVPLEARGRTLIAAPLFHAWGAGQFLLSLSLVSTIVLQRSFDPEATLAAVERFRPDALVVVPVMLQRILALDESVRARYDTSSLRVVIASGSALPSELATRFMDEFGDVLYDLYGSTEIAWASIATPEDLRAAPGTVGRPPPGTRVAILDERGSPLAPGQTGRIFAAHELLFEGYTDGRSKELVDGMMSAGDVGHLDESGRLFVDSREDDMIVSGGENVYPDEVEELLHHHPEVDDVAVIGVDDAEFGQRLKAFVVRRAGAGLDADAVRAHVRDRLARYKVPRDVEFVEELPRNATGKVLKRELAKAPDRGGS